MSDGDQLPRYEEHEQGVDQDIRDVPLSTHERQTRTDRYGGARRALAGALNPDEPTSADVVRELMTTANEHQQHATRSNLAVIYLRVSTEEQARVGGTAEGYSIPYQRDACRQKARQLGLTVADEYIDAGHSAKSANRPELQRMLRELRDRQIGYVIVHKIDRLARNTRDDHQINAAITAAGARLVSVVDLIDDSPQGRFNYVIQAGLAQLYSDNLAVEVMKGLTKKVQTGGTPYRAPIGYLNKRRFEGMADIRWVELDPERAPLVRWAFEEYATGDWSIVALREALIDKGLRTRATAKQTSKVISINGLHKLLTNPYYAGVVPFQGAYHEGSHEPLIDLTTWMRVQNVLKAHNFAGDKDFKHAHYLKGSIWCGNCGSRLIFSRNRGKMGKQYDYFACIGRHRKRNNCTRSVLTVDSVVAGVEDFYRRFEVPPEQVSEIRAAVGEEFARVQAVAETDIARSRRRLGQVKDQRQKLLDAHYQGAIPADMLKTEMQRLTAELASAETELTAVSANLTDLQDQLGRALTAAGHCAEAYEQAPPAVRRQLNQGFFEKLYIAEDGTVQDADLNQPFAALLTGSHDDHPEPARPNETPGDAQTDRDEAGGQTDRSRPSIILTTIWDGENDVKTPGRAMILTGGSNVDVLAEAEGFEPPVP